MQTPKFSAESQRYILQALAVAVLTAAVVVPMTSAQQLVPSVGVRGPIAPPRPPAPDTDNSGRPEDPATPQTRVPGDLMSASSSVYVDDSFASVDSLRKAIRFATQNQSTEAINEFQNIVNNFGQKLVLLNDNSYVSITDFVRERLLQMPAVKNGMYDQIYGGEARKEVDAAIENRDVATLIRVSDRYFPSNAALKGLSQAAEWYFERGEFSAAAQTWRKLLVHPFVGDHKADFVFRAALAQHLAQNDSDSKALRDRLEKDFPDATGAVGGKEVKLLSKLDELVGLPAWEKVMLGGDEWPAFEGGASRNALLTTHAAIGAKLWSIPISDSTSSVDTGNLSSSEIRLLQAQAGIRVSGSLQLSDGSMNSHPVLSGGAMFVHLGNQLVSISASSGTKLWTYPSRPLSDQAAAQLIRNYGLNPYGNAHNSAAIFGDQVFAIMPTGGGLTSSGGLPALPTKVVCLNRQSGDEIWSRNAAEIKLEKDGALTFVGSPTVTRQGVFIMARKVADQSFSQQYLVRLDRDTGMPTWSCYLCSTSTTNSSSAAAANIAVPTLVDDILYISTGQGADCAVDANVGRILWLRVTGTKSEINSTRPIPSWQFNPPVIIGDKMLTTDNLQNLRLYDRWTGQLIKTIRGSDLPGTVSGQKTVDVLAGSIGTKVVFSIKGNSYCYDIEELAKDKPKPEWTAEITGVGSPQGRPFLTEKGYYVPFTSKLVHIDTDSGKFETWEWPFNEKQEAGKPGNLLVTSEQVVVVNDQEIAGYSKWETARDNRLQKIAEHPNDPLPYLDLAEISFRTDHQDLAQEKMKQSVDLANGGAVTAGQSVTEMLARLYRTNLAFAEQLLAKKETEKRDQSRFYYEQCRAAARTPEQQSEWRMRLAELAKMQSKFDESAVLYSDILTDPALRAAGYREADGLQSAGSAAEKQLRNIITKNGVSVFKPFEDKAAALTQRAIAAKDIAGLQQVVDGYPNSTASLAAATTLAGLYQDKQEWENARRVLWWLEPRIEGDAQAKAIANLATVSLGLKKYSSASAWASRGLRQYKEFSWSDGPKKITFAELKSQILKVGGTEIEGRLPALAAPGKAVALEDSPMKDDFVTGAQLLVPVETSLALRQPNLMFIRTGNKLRIYDTAKGADLANDIQLPNDRDTILLGSTRDIAVLMQDSAAIGVDLKTKTTWVQTLEKVPGAVGPNRPPVINGRQYTINRAAGQQVQLIGGNVIVTSPNGAQQNLGSPDTVTIVDSSTGEIVTPGQGADPDSVRRAAFMSLGNQIKFTSARIINGNLVILAGSQLDAYNIETGKPAWMGPGGSKISAHLPDGAAGGYPVGIVGNEDLVVAQLESSAGKSTTFCAFDVETGKPTKQVKLDSEHVSFRALGDDGTLFVITDPGTSGAGAVAAYDMVSDQNRALWRRTDVGSRFANAAVLTLDGLIVVNDINDVMCLATDTGDPRWQAPIRINLLSTSTASSNLRSTVEGDYVIFQSSDGSSAFNTQPQMKDQMAWASAPVTDLPPRQSLQNSDAQVLEMLVGSMGGRTSRSDYILVLNRKGGLMTLKLPITNNATTTEGPLIRSWQVLDNGIAFDVLTTPPTGANAAGRIYFWRTK